MTTLTEKREGTTETRESRVAENFEGMWGEMTSQEGLTEIVFRRPLPMDMIQTYAQAATDHAMLEQHADGGWFASIEGFPGVWAKESSQRLALEVLEEVVLEWTLLKIRDEDRDLPVLDSLDQNLL